MTCSNTPIATLTAMVLAALFITAGCDSTSPQEDQEDFSHIQEVRISPDSTGMSVGETVDFSFALLTAEGDTVEADLNTRWESTDESVFTVTSTGLATAVAAGEAKCVIEASSYAQDKASDQAGETDASAALDVLGFVGQDSARVVVF